MDRSRLNELHYITKIENVPSMLELGILSHRRAERIPHSSVAMEVIQERRAKKVIPGGQRLHDYVNLYINGRNVMMSKVLYESSVDEMCLLRVHTAVLDLPGAVLADQNASSDYVRFSNAATGLAQIRDDYVFAESWKHPDNQIEEWRHKSAMCAEILVPGLVNPDYIIGVYVGSDTAREDITTLAPSLDVTTDQYKFFR